MVHFPHSGCQGRPLQMAESRARGIWWDSFVIEVTWFSVDTHVLAEKYVLWLDRLDCREDLHLNVDAMDIFIMHHVQLGCTPFCCGCPQLRRILAAPWSRH